MKPAGRPGHRPSVFDDHPIKAPPCPNCERENVSTFGHLRRNATLRCESCGFDINVRSAEIDSYLRDADAVLEEGLKAREKGDPRS